jgi:hypothetical protein
VDTAGAAAAAAPTPLPPQEIKESFDEFVAARTAEEGGFATNAARYAGSTIKWDLSAMGYEENGGFDSAKPVGPDNWSQRLRMFSASLDPKSDLAAVMASKSPVIVAIVPAQGQGYNNWEGGEKLDVEATIWGVANGELFLKDYSILGPEKEEEEEEAEEPAKKKKKKKKKGRTSRNG